MRIATSDLLLSGLSEFLSAQMGLNFSRDRWPDLERGIAGATSEFGMASVEACIRWLLSGPLTNDQIEILASHLTVGETYFFREERSFEVLEGHVLPALLRARADEEGRIRIWSAGCATGEEPYSIAMLIDRTIPDAAKKHITILATDINPRFLRKAADGVYGQWSFRGTAAALQERYFRRKKDGRFEIKPHIRKMVTFSYLNLAKDPYPSLGNNTNAIDVIFCRNVLIYFGAEQAKAVVKNLHRSLVDGGWLVPGATETSNTLFSAYAPVQFPGLFLYRKAEDGVPRTVAAGPRMAPSDFAPNPSYFMPSAATTEWTTAQTIPPPPPQQAPPEPATATLGEPESEDSRVSYAMARACANEGRLIDAGLWCEKAIASDKLNPVLYYLFATIRLEQGQGDAAIQLFNRALYLAPEFVLAHFALANQCLSRGRHRDAERHFGNALALLREQRNDEVLPESDGLTVERLIHIITSIQSSLVRPHKAPADV